jgi:thioesterase domain-containing protein
VDRRLVAYVVPARPGAVAQDDLRRHLAAQLPAYMVPSEILATEALPLRPNGKVDRGVLCGTPLPAGPPTGTEVAAAAGDPGPQAEIVERLQRVWSSVVGHAIGPNDDFFESWGHSLLAVRILDRVNHAFGTRLPVGTIFTARTVQEMAVRIARSPADAPKAPVVHLGGGDRGAPLFCIPGIGGNADELRPFARRLGVGRPVCAVNYPEPAELDAVPRTIEELADRMLGPVRRRQPEGPYYLAGFSLGGLVAFEFARRLAEQGQAVEMLAVWDTYPGTPASLPLLRQAALLLRRLSVELARRDFREIRRLAGVATRRLRAALSGISGRADLPGDAAAPHSAHEVFLDACRQAADDYDPDPYSGSMLLLCSHREDWEDFLYRRWERLALGGVTRGRVAAVHGQMLREPHVNQLAAIMAEALRAGAPLRSGALG